MSALGAATVVGMARELHVAAPAAVTSLVDADSRERLRCLRAERDISDEAVARQYGLAHDTWLEEA
jgi:hypothetical protein